MLPISYGRRICSERVIIFPPNYGVTPGNLDQDLEDYLIHIRPDFGNGPRQFQNLPTRGNPKQWNLEQDKQKATKKRKRDEEEANANNATITIRVKDQRNQQGWISGMGCGSETYFKVKMSTKMSKVFGAYAQLKGAPPTSLRFHIDGEPLRFCHEETPRSLELEDQDQIECTVANAHKSAVVSK